jgi:hypothetical protein
MRTPGGEVVRGHSGKSATDGSLAKSIAVHDVAVLCRCTASGWLVKRRGLSFRPTDEGDLGMASYLRWVNTAEQIIEFVRGRMRMSHVYQPLLIRALVRCGGSATLRQLATALLVEDESQLLYYEDRVKKMPLPVLRGHGIVTSDRGLVSLNAGRLTYEQRPRSSWPALRSSQSSCSAAGWPPGTTG